MNFLGCFLTIFLVAITRGGGPLPFPLVLLFLHPASPMVITICYIITNRMNSHHGLAIYSVVKRTIFKLLWNIMTSYKLVHEYSETYSRVYLDYNRHIIGIFRMEFYKNEHALNMRLTRGLAYTSNLILEDLDIIVFDLIKHVFKAWSPFFGKLHFEVMKFDGPRSLVIPPFKPTLSNTAPTSQYLPTSSNIESSSQKGVQSSNITLPDTIWNQIKMILDNKPENEFSEEVFLQCVTGLHGRLQKDVQKKYNIDNFTHTLASTTVTHTIEKINERQTNNDFINTLRMALDAKEQQRNAREQQRKNIKSSKPTSNSSSQEGESHTLFVEPTSNLSLHEEKVSLDNRIIDQSPAIKIDNPIVENTVEIISPMVTITSSKPKSNKFKRAPSSSSKGGEISVESTILRDSSPLSTGDSNSYAEKTKKKSPSPDWTEVRRKNPRVAIRPATKPNQLFIRPQVQTLLDQFKPGLRSTGQRLIGELRRAIKHQDDWETIMKDTNLIYAEWTATSALLLTTDIPLSEEQQKLYRSAIADYLEQKTSEMKVLNRPMTTSLKFCRVPTRNTEDGEVLSEDELLEMIKEDKLWKNVEIFGKPRFIKPKQFETLPPVATVLVDIKDTTKGEEAKTYIGSIVVINGQHCKCLPWIHNEVIPQCKSCYRWGHNTFTCKTSFVTCARCGDNHPTDSHFLYCDECVKGEMCQRIKCINCQGNGNDNHSALDASCPFRKAQTNSVTMKTLMDGYRARKAQRREERKSAWQQEETERVLAKKGITVAELRALIDKVDKGKRRT